MPERMFETRSDAWEAVGLSVDVSQRRGQARPARGDRAVPAADRARDRLRPPLRASSAEHAPAPPQPRSQTSLQTPLQIAVAIALVVIGWALARDASRFAGPTFMRRMDPATAGTVGFLIRLLTIVVTVLVALSVAGAELQTLAVGGGFTAVVVGLAAQQTLGNAIAGMVLLSARPFRVGERIRLQAGAVGGSVEGIVSSLGLLYTTLTRGADRIMIPNNVVLAAASCRCKRARRRSTSRCADLRACGPARCRRSSTTRSPRPTSSEGGAAGGGRRRRRRRARPGDARSSPTTAPSWPTRSWPRWPRSPASTPIGQHRPAADTPALGASSRAGSALVALALGHPRGDPL